MYTKTACKFQIKFIAEDYLQKHYNYLQTHLHLIQTNLQASKLLKSKSTDTKLFKMPSQTGVDVINIFAITLFCKLDFSYECSKYCLGLSVCLAYIKSESKLMPK